MREPISPSTCVRCGRRCTRCRCPPGCWGRGARAGRRSSPTSTSAPTCGPSASHALLVGGTEPACDPLEWVDDPDAVDVHLTRERYDAHTLRAARRLPGLRVPNRPLGVVGVYDVTSDWTPVYDRTDLPGWFVAMGTSGNQFKNAPLVGDLLVAVVSAVESGHDHDADPVRFTLPYTGNVIDLGSFSRLRERNAASSGTVMG